MKRRQIRMLYVYNGIFILAGNLLVPLYGVYLQRLQGSTTLISMAWLVLLGSTTFFSLFLSSLSKKVREQETLLLAGYLIRAVAWALLIGIDGIAGLLALQVLLGLGEALGSPAFDTLFAESINRKDRFAEYNRWKIFSNVSTAIGAGIGGVIVAAFGFTPLFALMSLLAFASAFGIFLNRNPIPAHLKLPFTLQYVPEYALEEWED